MAAQGSEIPNYEDMFLNLKHDVWFFFVRNQDTILGKLFYLGSHKKQAKPNKTATMLLYLLARDEGDDIHFNTVRNLMYQKFDFKNYDEATKELNKFLDTLDHGFSGGHHLFFYKETGELKQEGFRKYGILEKKVAEGRRGTPVPDPMMLFEVPQGEGKMEWMEPKLNLSELEPIVNKSHFYARPEDGVNGGTIRR